VTISYHAHHSPIGANASFTMGKLGTRGGFGLENGRPADHDLFIGYRRGTGPAHVLPFYQGGEMSLDSFLVEGAGEQVESGIVLSPFSDTQISRSQRWATDSWSAPDLTFQLLTPCGPVPDPAVASAEEMKLALAPAILAQLTIDNAHSPEPLVAFFALGNAAKSLRPLDDTTGGTLRGIAFQREWGFATMDAPGIHTYMDFSLEEGLRKSIPEIFRLASHGGILIDVAPGEVKTVVIALGFFREGIVTTGIATRYFYSRYFTGLEDVLAYTLAHVDELLTTAAVRDAELLASSLSANQQFMLAHATRSYFGNTEFLEAAGQPLWVVNEGEYQMMNTFDLTVDMLFFELRFNPWTVRNVLDQFADRYSYFDQVKHPAEPGVWYPGGISFTHEMGIYNQFAPAEYSAYERTGLDGCFSHMTHEQLTNWVLCATLYIHHTGDEHWLERRKGIFRECLQSLLNRDGRTAQEYDGVMDMDSSRCGLHGQEITTYDSLDVSLGQARNNLYLAGKTWASYVSLQWIFRRVGWGDLLELADAGAIRCAATIVANYRPETGFIPAVFEAGNSSCIIPAIEGLVFPYLLGDRDAVSETGRYGTMIETLKAHMRTVLQPGVCIDAEGHWWKMSSTSRNTWFSKVAICQFAARQVLGFTFGDQDAVFDTAHADWQRIGSSEWAMCDQIVDGLGQGSRYYPRGVSCILWLEETLDTAVLTKV